MAGLRLASRVRLNNSPARPRAWLAGNWDTRVQVSGHDEVALLASSFNQMTTELLAQKERLVQAERVPPGESSRGA